MIIKPSFGCFFYHLIVVPLNVSYNGYLNFTGVNSRRKLTFAAHQESVLIYAFPEKFQHKMVDLILGVSLTLI